VGGGGGGAAEPGRVWWPGQNGPQVRQEVASTLDVFATVAEAVGAPLPPGRAYDSVSLLPLLPGKTQTPPRNESFFYAGATLQVRASAQAVPLCPGRC
jgi:arylsulfatase A-like enzyme